MIGGPLQKSKGNGDKLFPWCSGPDCWCLDCAFDSIDCEYNLSEIWSENDEKAFNLASSNLKKYYMRPILKNSIKLSNK